MKIQNHIGLAIFFALLLFLFAFPFQAQGSRLYLETSLKANEAARLESAGKVLDARVMFDECLFYMECLHILKPGWEAALVQKKIGEYRGKVAALKAQALQEAMSPQTRDSANALFDKACMESAKEGREYALRDFEKAFMIMTLVHERDSVWPSEPISKNFERCRTKLADLRAQILASGAGDSEL